MRASAFAIFGAGLLLAGCASQEMVVVLPAADGHVGGVVVHPNKGETVVLDKPYAADVPGDSHVTTATAESVDKQFHDVLGARPKEPGHHKLFFLNGTDTMTDASRIEFETQVKTDVDGRLAAEIVIIGYTDRVGSQADNDRLSRERADAIKVLLEQKGNLRAGIQITTDGRGERDDTDPDGTPNPSERYVDIIVQ